MNHSNIVAATGAFALDCTRCSRPLCPNLIPPNTGWLFVPIFSVRTFLVAVLVIPLRWFGVSLDRYRLLALAPVSDPMDALWTCPHHRVRCLSHGNLLYSAADRKQPLGSFVVDYKKPN